MIAHRLGLAPVCALLACAFALALGGTSALAFNEHVTPPTSFGSSGTGTGQFSNPDGIAVEQSTGDVYVVDTGNDRVEKLTSSGAYITQFGSAGSGPGQLDEPRWVAIAESGLTTDVYVADTGNKRVEEFESTGGYVDELTGTPTGPGGAVVPFSEVGGVAVDPSGNLWVAAGANVDEFNSNGALLQMLTSPEPQDEERTFSGLKGLAVDSKDDFFGFHEKNSELGNPETVHEWASNGIYEFGEIDRNPNSLGYQDTGIAIDPGSTNLDDQGAIYIASNQFFPEESNESRGPIVSQFASSCVQEYEGISDDGCVPLESFGVGELGLTGGVAVNASTGAAYVVQRESDSVKVFAATVLPDVATGEATARQPTSAKLNGTLNPDGTAITSCKFEYIPRSNFNQVAIVTLTGATGGYFKLGFGRGRNSEGAALPYNASAEEVESELAGTALTGGSSNLEVTGPAGGPYRIEFKGLLSGATSPVGSLLKAATYALEPSSARITSEDGDWSAAAAVPCSSVPNGSSPAGVQATVAGLEPEQEYDYRLAASDPSGRNLGAAQGFVTPVAPGVSGESASVAPATSATSVRATVTAEIDAGGLPTSYRVDYGETVAHGLSTPEASIGEGVGAVKATVHLEGLTAGRTYHFRFVASNALGSAEGEEMTFTAASLSAASSLLPDDRVYEVVSADDTRFGSVYVPSETETEFAAGPPERTSLDGNALTYVGPPAAEGGNGNEGSTKGDSYLAKRSPGGWSASNITPPNVDYTAGFKVFSSDLSAGILTMLLAAKGGPTPITPGGPASGAFVRAPDGSFHLVAGPWVLGAGAYSEAKEEGYRGGTPDLSHVVIEVKGDLYLDEWATEQLSSALNVLPNGATEAGPKFDAISTDGKDVVWSGGGKLYVSEDVGTAQARTVQLDASQGAGPGGGGVFAEGPYGESPDELPRSFNGSQVLFTDEDAAGLTDDTVSGSGTNLYELELASGDLVDLTPAAHAEVQSVVGTSEDGSYVYFTAAGVLTQGPNAEGKEPVAGEPNLYVRHDGVTSFIATNVAGRQVSPDGAHFLLQSNASGAVYVYDASSGKLNCASCVNGDAIGVTLGNNREAGSGAYFIERYVPHWMSDEGDRVFFEAGSLVPQDTIGASVYEWESEGTSSCQTAGGCIYLISGGTSRGQFIDASANGENVFFTTYSSLLSQDTNDYVDVYDARVGTRPTSPPLCTGSGCQGVPGAPPIFATPSSATFNGVGNFEAPAPAVKVKSKAKTVKCKKGFVKKKGKCVKKPKAKKKRKAKKSSTRSNRGSRR